MTNIIGLTGGIGSGKTTVAKYFQSLGVPVYIADEAGKKILGLEDNKIAVRKVFGKEVFNSGEIDRKKLAALVFADPEKLATLNSIVHPAVKRDFVKWLRKHEDHKFIIKESAILFESGSYKECTAVITVVAPQEIRIQRIMKRDNLSGEEILLRINNQWGDEEKIALSDFIIENLEIGEMHRQVQETLKKLQNV